MITKFQIKTNKKRELIDVTDRVLEIISASGIKEGICAVYVPHATAALIVNENEMGLKEDILKFLENLVPKNDYLHNHIDNNAEAHIISSVLGTNRTFIVNDGELIRGTWQNIFFVELDGPRQSRQVIVKTISSN